MNSLRITTIGFVIIALLSGYSCNNKNVPSSGVTASKEIQTPNVSKVKMLGMAKLIITQDINKNEYLTINADEAIMPYIVTNVSNNELEIKMKDEKTVSSSTSPVYTLTVKDMSHIDVSGAAHIELPSLKTDTLDIKVSGGSHINGTLDVATLAVRASGANAIELNGKADMQKITLEGAAKFDGSNLTGKEADLEISGASNVTLNVTDAIDGAVSGMSTISYRNNPVMKATASGMSSINKS
jgi:hypothetical protein